MIDLEKIRIVLIEFFAQATGISPFIIEDQASHRPPSGNYGTIKLSIGPIMSGYDSEEITEDGDFVDIETAGQREITCSTNIYRHNAVELMAKLQTRLQSRRFQEQMRFRSIDMGQSFVFIDSLSIQDLSALLQSEYEERSQMDIRLRTVSTYTDKVETIGTITLSGEVENVAEEPRAQGNCTITES